MAEIVNLLFDHYTKNLDVSDEMKKESEKAQIRYQQLKEIAGEDDAIEIWDTAVGEGAVMQEICFQAGLKTGIALALELLSLP